MAYADIQNKVGQIQMANRILLAQRMNPNKTPETDLEGFQEQGGYAREQIGDPSLPEIDENTTVEGTLDRRKRISGGTYKGKNKKPKKELPSDADIQTEGNMRGQPKPEDIFGEDYEGGPTYLRQLLQIGGAAGSMIPFMGGNILKMLIGGPKVIAGVPNFPGGGYGSTSGAFVDLSGEAYFLIDGELIPQGGYDPAKHGDLIPHGGPDIPQAINNTNNSMKIYG